MWNLTPRTAIINGVATTTPATCVTCHNTLSAANPPVIQVPAGQIDLTGGASNVVTTVVTSYEQLLFSHDEQSLNMGILLNTVPEPGPPDPVTGLPTTIEVAVLLPAPMTAGSASGSEGRFFRLFDGSYHDPVLDHTGYLTPRGCCD